MKFLKGLVFPLGFLAFWEIGMRAFHVESNSLAPPSQIAVAFYDAVRDGTIAHRTAEPCSRR